jgi:hypothetical protein
MITVDDENFMLILKEHKADHAQSIKAGKDYLPSRAIEEIQDILDVIRKVLKNKQINLYGAAILYQYSYEYLKSNSFPDLVQTDCGNGVFAVRIGVQHPYEERVVSLNNEHNLILVSLYKYYTPVIEDYEFCGLSVRKEVA